MLPTSLFLTLQHSSEFRPLFALKQTDRKNKPDEPLVQRKVGNSNIYDSLFITEYDNFDRSSCLVTFDDIDLTAFERSNILLWFYGVDVKGAFQS